MGFWGLLAINLALFVVGRLLLPKPKAPKQDFSVPRSEEGGTIPILYGTQEMASNVVSVVTVRKSKVDQFWRYNARIHHVFCWGMVNELIDLSWDEKSARNWHETFNAGTYPIWVLPATPVLPGAIPNIGAQVTQFINGDQQPNGNYSSSLFGGNQQGGGVEGNIKIYWGHDAQPQDTFLEAIGAVDWYGADKVSRWPRICYIRMGDDDPFYLAANSPVPNSMRAVLRRTAWWETALSPLGQTAAEATIGVDANPAEVLYDLITNKYYGLGRSPTRIDLQSFIDCAVTLRTEAFGISFVIDKPVDAKSVIDQILETIDATLATDPTTGKLRLKLIRADYGATPGAAVPGGGNVGDGTVGSITSDASAPTETITLTCTAEAANAGTFSVVGSVSGVLPDATVGVPYNSVINFTIADGAEDFDIGDTFTIEVAGIPRITPANSWDLEYSPSSWAETHNEVWLSYRRFVDTTERIGFVEAVITGGDDANREATGRTRSLSVDMPYLTNSDLAAVVLERIRISRGIPLGKFRGKMNRDGYRLMQGDPVVIEAGRFGIGEVVVRITRINYGSPNKAEVEYEAVQDVFAVTSAVFTAPAESAFVDPVPEADDPTDSGGGSIDRVTWGTVHD